MGRIFGRKKKKTEDAAIWMCEGVRLLNRPEIGTGGVSLNGRRRADSRGIAAKCILEVLITAGAMCGFLSCIEMNYGIPLIFLTYTALSVYFCSLFKSGKLWVRDVGYVIFLVVFVVFIYVFRRYVNSGFYAMVNQFLDKVTDYYAAEEVKVFTETIENRSVTVPIAATALGCISIIILNIFINTNMSMLWALIFSLPVFIFPLFFRLEPDAIYLFMVTVGLLGVACLKGNGHFHITERMETFEYDRKKSRLTYRHSDKASRQIVACVALICIIAGGAVMVARPLSSYTYRYRDSSVKDRLEEPLGNLIMYGFESLRNMNNTGGLANGQLGGVSDVYFDGNTDLTLRLAPAGSERIYLRSFVGDAYSKDHWDRDEDGLYPSPNSDAACQRMDIYTEYELGSTPFYPYYTMYDTELGEALNRQDLASVPDSENDIYSVYRVGGLNYLTVHYSSDTADEPELATVDDKYLDIPDINISYVAEFCESAGIEDYDSDSEKIAKVYSYFVSEYPYTLHPGSTPRNEDYVNYFLGTTKKGLCANYATAGTLILRYLGIPARYVEGYAVDYDEILDGSVVNDSENAEEFSEYYEDGLNAENIPVMDVAVTDSSAHAWIEAFMDGRWQVVELTPPSSEEEDEDTEDFWTRLARLLAGDDSGDADSGDGGNTGSAFSFSLSGNMWIIYILLGTLACAALIFVLFIAAHKLVRICGWHGRNKAANIVAYYKYMCSYMRLANDSFDLADSHSAQLAVMSRGMAASEIQELADYLEAVSYGNRNPGDEYRDRMAQLHAIFKEMKKSVPWLRRVYIFRKL